MGYVLWICVVLTVTLAVYALGYYLCTFVFCLSRPKTKQFEKFPDDSVAVFIPARDEGAGALRAMDSVLNQDHLGKTEIYLLLKDSSDSSVPLLESAYEGCHLKGDVDTPGVVKLLEKEQKKVFVAFAGVDGKSEKLNWAAQRIDTDYLAILDSDHLAHKSWIRSSICLMKEKGARIIQGKRGPLSAFGFFQLWDSLHQHIGCELFNRAFSRLKLTVFFTGTTVVMDADLFKSNPLRKCITEDVDFSYRIFAKGIKLISNPYYGSNEEVSPNLYSFLARRRRWANGHTDAFLRHMGLLASRHVSWKDRVQFVYHGLHYVMALLVFALHLFIGLFFFQGMSSSPRTAAVLAGVILAWLIVRSQRTKAFSIWLSEMAVVFGWIFPAVVIAMNLVVAVLLRDASRAALPIPYYIQVLGLIGFGAPLLALLVGMAGFRQLGPSSVIVVIVTFPVAFYLDVAGVLIGIVDLIFGRQHWHTVARAQRRLDEVPNTGTDVFPTPKDILASWRISSMLDSIPRLARDFGASLIRPTVVVPWVLLAGLLTGGALYTPTTRIAVMQLPCKIMKHDGHPWIVAPEKLEGYCDASPAPRWATRTGSYKLFRSDDLKSVDKSFWDVLDDTFYCNKAVFDPRNIVPVEGGGISFLVEKRPQGGKQYSSGSIATKKNPCDNFLYGRFETVLKPAKASGVLTAFFLYRFDPWQEIDTEFVGKDTSKILLNVFYNPGVDGDKYNYGYRGTPVQIDLGFDASKSFHKYAVEWDPRGIRWFVDGKLIHERSEDRPTPIPHLPMRFHVNAWPTCSEELSGAIDDAALPSRAEIKSINIYKWKPAPFPKLSLFMDSVMSWFSGSARQDSWRSDAYWLQSGKYGK